MALTCLPEQFIVSAGASDAPDARSEAYATWARSHGVTVAVKLIATCADGSLASTAAELQKMTVGEHSVSVLTLPWSLTSGPALEQYLTAIDAFAAPTAVVHVTGDPASVAELLSLRWLSWARRPPSYAWPASIVAPLTASIVTHTGSDLATMRAAVQRAVHAANADAATTAAAGSSAYSSTYDADFIAPLTPEVARLPEVLMIGPLPPRGAAYASFVAQHHVSITIHLEEPAWLAAGVPGVKLVSDRDVALPVADPRHRRMIVRVFQVESAGMTTPWLWTSLCVPWVDFGVLPPANMQTVLREYDAAVRGAAGGSPVVHIHCKGGMGRSGTLALSRVLSVSKPPGPHATWRNDEAERVKLALRSSRDHLVETPTQLTAAIDAANEWRAAHAAGAMTASAAAAVPAGAMTAAGGV